MHQAWTLSFEVPWIAAAEDAIIERFAGVDWHLEDENDDPITDASPPDAQAALRLLEKPAANLAVGARYYRADMWALTGRAMGICGSAFILLDALESLAGTPSAMLPIAPWRLFAEEDQAGNLIGWSIDKTQTDPGIPVRLDQILHFQLRRNFIGHFGIGLIESALLKARLATGLDSHLGLVLSAGGRLSGILSPKTGAMETETMLQMERDWRTVVEQSDAAKRLQLVRAPIDFQKTTLTPQEMQIRDLMNGARDDLLSLWGVPLSIIGGTTPAGLNSGDTRKYDEAAIWQGPVHHRLNIFREVMQYELLDRYAGLGSTIELELEEPEFDDDSPRYDLLGKSLNTPMTTEERRALIGLPPTGDPAIDNAILLPATIVPYAMVPVAPDETTPTTTTLGRAAQDTSTSDEAVLAAGETSKAAIPTRIHPHVKPLHTALTRVRENVARAVTPILRRNVALFLSEQQNDIAARLRKHASTIAANPRDTSTWFPAATYDRKLRDTLRPHLTVMAESVVAQVNDVLPAKAGPAGAVDRTLERGAARVTKINETTRDAIASLIATTIEQGGSVLDAADALETLSIFDEYRSELIARTELMDAYNGAALGSYADAGLGEVQAIDGDGDPECAERDGQVFSIEEADSIEDHPNGTLDWVPVFGEEQAPEAKASQISSQPYQPVKVIVNVPPAPAPEKPASMTVQRGEDGKILRVVPEGNEADARIEEFVRQFTELGKAQAERPIVVTPPDVHVEAPIVNVPAPIVNVIPPEPVPPKKGRIIRTPIRDEDGTIVRVVEEEA